MNPNRQMLLETMGEAQFTQFSAKSSTGSLTDLNLATPFIEATVSKGLGIILVPIDFSPESFSVARFGIRLAQLHKAKIILFHAVSEKLTPIGPANPDWLKAVLTIEAQGKAESLLFAAQQSGVTAICDIEAGPTATAILQAAARWRADLILLTECFRSWWKRWLGSSTIRHVIQNSECGVMVVQPVCDAPSLGR